MIKYNALNNVPDQDATNFSVTLGLGFDYEFSKVASFGLQAIYGFNFGDTSDKNTTKDGNDNYFNPSIGVKVHFDAPKDSDKDGIPDKYDACHQIPGLAQFNVCPDTDGDGIIDSEDLSPTVAGLAALKGCPDEDGDGITDIEDECPNIKGIAKFKGCHDTDGDGIVDPKDKCPKLFGVAANNGCPEIKKEVKEILTKAMEGVYFDTNLSKIKKVSFKVLDNVVTVMKNNPDYKLQIDGHTDNVGDDAKNLQLSKDRVKAVKDYLVSKKVDAGQLFSEGYGETKPKATNDTKEGRAQNRRVEFTVIF